MTSPKKRQPLPALVFILALCLLAALVWWRVLHRDDRRAPAQPPCTPPVTQKLTQLPAPGSVTLSVLNSTQRNGLGAAVAAVLKQDGFLIPAKAANDSTPVAGVAEIRYGPTAVAGATLLSYYLPGASLVRTASATSTVVLSLGARYQRTATPADVQAKLAAAGITLTAAGSAAPKPPASPSC
jgi:hypothetical protein